MSLRLPTALVLLVGLGCAEADLSQADDGDLGGDFKADTLGATAATPNGLGAIPYAGGTHFGVWAPNADAVAVAGAFNGWSAARAPMTRDAAGVWSADVPGALAGQAYELVLQRAGQTTRKIDPRARAVTSSIGKAVIVDPAAHVWSTAGYRTPAFNEQVVYEMHIGAFN